MAFPRPIYLNLNPRSLNPSHSSSSSSNHHNNSSNSSSRINLSLNHSPWGSHPCRLALSEIPLLITVSQSLRTLRLAWSWFLINRWMFLQWVLTIAPGTQELT